MKVRTWAVSNSLSMSHEICNNANLLIQATLFVVICGHFETEYCSCRGNFKISGKVTQTCSSNGEL